MTGRHPPVRSAPGSVEDALANGQRLLPSNPAAAALQARTILRSAPDSVPAVRLLARALLALGEDDDAQAAMASAIRMTSADPAVQTVMGDLRSGNPVRARKAAQALHTRRPDDPVAALLLGEARLQLHDWAGAIAAFGHALSLAPGYPPAQLGLARAQHLRFDIAAAQAALAPLLAPASATPDAALFEATLRAEAGDHAAAERIIGALVATSPDAPDLQIAHGDALRTLGRRSEAEAAYRRAIARQPHSGRAWWGVTNVAGDRLPREDVTAIEAAARSARDPTEATLAAFAAAATCRGGDARSEMDWLQRANASRRAALAYDEARFAARMHQAAGVASARFFASRDGWGDPSPSPIFIVGTPRSGSTLLERMLGQHSMIETCGELPLVPALLHEAGADLGIDPAADLASVLRRLTKRQSAELGSEYLRRAAVRRHAGKPHFTDKLPHNWADATFIRLILPHATIVDLRRAPLDCIVSNFRTVFAPGHPASYDIEEMAGYYAIYAQAMDAFRDGAPQGYHRVVYERLVDAPTAVLTSVLKTAGLSFEPSCLDFASSRAAVSTASVEQVGRPLNRDGIDIWQRFDGWLGQARDRLGPVLSTWDA